MIKDRDQKQKALRLSAAKRWLPQLEVEVRPGTELGQKPLMITDVDVLSLVPDEFEGFRSILFDCKTKAKESPVNRALWLTGVMRLLGADSGFCVLKKDAIMADHRVMAIRLQVVLLAEDEFDLFARHSCAAYDHHSSNVSNIDVWDHFFSIPAKFPKLESAMKFLKSDFWMIADSAESCRKTLWCLRSVRAELDPSRPEHLAIFFDFCTLFAQSLSIMICELFRCYLLPKTQGDLEGALHVMLWGGRDAYEHRNEMYKHMQSKLSESTPADLALPEWQRFLDFVRQGLDAPFEFQRSPLILREIGFSILANDPQMSYAKALCRESSQGARFALLLPTYLVKAAKLPPEFANAADNIILPLIAVK